MPSALETILRALRDGARDLTAPYFVPGLWVDHQHTAAQAVNPYQFYADCVAGILAAEPQPLEVGAGGGEWTRHARIYNLFPRVTAAFDHNRDGALTLGPSPDGWRETGTLLKCLALLPYIRSMNLNTVYLLPIASVGQDGKKGTLGSPYAIRNPYELDPNLAEPALGLDVNTLFAGFVEAAHRLGMRVVMEFVLRTASKDGDLIGAHPEWFYWIRESVPDRAPGSSDPFGYGSPIFSPQELATVYDRVNRGDFAHLPPPPAAFTRHFTPPPAADRVRLENGRWVGALDDGTRVRIPGAFTDWPPDDVQPPWTDVTYLRLYDHPDFSYMAYNTIRMYDARLARPEHEVRDLWDWIVGIIPHYQRAFGIDGVMIDMGHALPQRLKQRIVAAARAQDPNFAFWEENFVIGRQSVEEGYNAALGYLVFDLHQPGKLREFLARLDRERLPLPFFATAETHNTPRAASHPNALQFVHFALALSIMLPGLPFIHSGFELMETKPINTGLGFSNEQIRRHPPEELPLFSAWAFDWTRPDNLVGSIRYAMGLRRSYDALLSDPDPRTSILGSSDNPNFVVFARQNDDTTLTMIASDSLGARERGRAFLPIYRCDLAPLWGTDAAHLGQGTVQLEAELGNGHVIILEGCQDFPRLRTLP